jgi:uncharacterized protein YtpQ (UPF0354 family)
LALGLGAFVTLGIASMLAWRRQLADEFAAYLTTHLPDWRIETRSSSRFVLRNGEDAAEFSLLNLRSAAVQIRGDVAAQTKGRQELFATAIAAFREQVELLASKPNVPALLERVFPRIVNDSFLANLRDGTRIPRRALGNTSLHVVYVIDSAHAVAYIDAERMASLGMDETVLHSRAIENLSRLWPVEATRKAVENGSVVVTKALDSYDAARLLLLPERLRDQEEVAALIPDRDTLVVAPVPADGNWSRLDRLARSTAGPELFAGALHVSAAGIRVA